MPKISILGCGWLGLPLAEELLKTGWSVNGSTTSLEKINVLEKIGINPFLVHVTADRVDGNIVSLLEGCDYLIIDFPPKLRNNASENFVSKIENLIPYIERSNIRNVIFVSSISVYGEEEVLITEETIPNPKGESGRQLLASEHILMKNESFITTVVRFGGLVGKDRHPVFHLAGKANLENPGAPINLIHLSDCIGILLAILAMKPENGIFNAVTPFHPLRKEYYETKAAQMNLEKPIFVGDDKRFGKIICSEKLQKFLGYHFLVTKEI